MLSSHALSPLFSESFGGSPDFTLWEKCKFPLASPPSHNSGSRAMASAHAAFSTALMDLLRTFCNFLSPCLCSQGCFLSEVQIHTHTLSLLGPVLPGFSCSVDFVLLGSTFVNQIVNAFWAQILRDTPNNQDLLASLDCDYCLLNFSSYIY